HEIARNVQEAAAGTDEVSQYVGELQDAASSAGNASAVVLSGAEGLSKRSDSLRAEVQKFLAQILGAA
ncbi:MAG: hypothetical protein MJE12_16945, partial [Alphaproteobacteria bacterium]|nr:hypothetical protein [Alphaproteobacteria bacterium]